MAKKYTIPQLLSLIGIRGYSPRLGNAVNTLLTTDSEIDYQSALQQASIELSDLYDYTEVGTYSKDSHFEGLPIYMPLLFQKIETTNDDYLLESAVVSISRQKNIVETVVQGRDTSVKEFINNGDYQINVTGLIAGHGVGYPKDKVKEFESFLIAKQSIKVVHEVLNALGVYEIVIKDYELSNSPFVNIQTYSFNAVSEEPIELTIDE